MYSHEEDDSGVGHGEGQAQDPAAHDGVAQVEDGHSKRRLPLELQRVDDARQAGDTSSVLSCSPSNTHVCEVDFSLRRGFMCEEPLVFGHGLQPVKPTTDKNNHSAKTSPCATGALDPGLTFTHHLCCVRSSSGAPFCPKSLFSLLENKQTDKQTWDQLVRRDRRDLTPHVAPLHTKN